MAKLLTRISTTALAAVTALTFASCGSKKTPMETVEDAASKSITAITENSDFAKKLDKVSNGGSIELRIDAGALLAMVAPISGLDLAASLKSYNDADGGNGALLANILSGGTSIADLLVYYMADNNSISASSNALFGKNVYGFSLDNFADAFNNSEFGEDGAYPLGISADDLTTAFGSARNYAAAYENFADLDKKIEGPWNTLKGDIYALIENNGTNATQDATLTVGGKDVKTTDVSFTYAGDQIADIIKGALELAKDNDSIEEILEAVTEATKSYAQAINAAYPDAGMDDLLDEMNSTSADDLMETINGAIDEGLDNMDDIRESLEDFEFSFTIHISKSSKELIGATIDISGNEDSVVMKAICGPSASDIDEISFSAEYDNGEETDEMYFKYEVTEDTNDTYAAELTGKLEGVKTKFLTVNWNKKSGELEVEIELEGESLAINGKLLTEKDSTTIAVNSASNGYETIDVGEIALIFNTNDTMPTTGAYTDILSMDETDITSLLGEIAESAQDIISLLGMY